MTTTDSRKDKFNNDARIVIIDNFMRDNSIDKITASAFVQGNQNPGDPAYDWFEWDNEVSGPAYRVWQARKFLAVRVKVQVTPPPELVSYKVNLVPSDAEKGNPAVGSPTHTQRYLVSTGNNEYLRTDSPDGKVMQYEQCIKTLKSFQRTFDSVIVESGAFAVSMELMRTIEDAFRARASDNETNVD